MPFFIWFLNKYNIRQPVRVSHLTNLALTSLSTSLANILYHSRAKFHFFCLTSWHEGSTFRRWCSITFESIPSISKGIHANTSAFFLHKSNKVISSYLIQVRPDLHHVLLISIIKGDRHQVIHWLPALFCQVISSIQFVKWERGDLLGSLVGNHVTSPSQGLVPPTFPYSTFCWKFHE